MARIISAVAATWAAMLLAVFCAWVRAMLWVVLTALKVACALAHITSAVAAAAVSALLHSWVNKAASAAWAQPSQGEGLPVSVVKGSKKTLPDAEGVLARLLPHATRVNRLNSSKKSGKALSLRFIDLEIQDVEELRRRARLNFIECPTCLI